MTPEVRLLWLPEADREVGLPAYASDGAAGADLRANFPPADRSGVTLEPGERRLVPTGFAVAVADGFEMQIRPRSGLALEKGITLANAPGTIDADYRGALGIILINLGDRPAHIRHGERIAQAVVAPVARAVFRPVESLDVTARGTGGFGSTGRG